MLAQSSALGLGFHRMWCALKGRGNLYPFKADNNPWARYFRLLKRIDSVHLDCLCLGIEGADDSHFLSGIGFNEFRLVQPVDLVLVLEDKSASAILDAI